MLPLTRISVVAVAALALVATSLAPANAAPAVTVTVPRSGCASLTVSVPTDDRPGGHTAYDVVVAGNGTSRQVLTGEGDGAVITDTIPFCHGEFTAGSYAVTVNATTTSPQSGGISLTTSRTTHSGVVLSLDVAAAAVSVSTRDIRLPQSCTLVPVTLQQGDLTNDERWSYRLLAQRPGASTLTEVTTATGTGPFLRTEGLQICPWDRLGTYLLSTEYTVTDVTGSASNSSTVSSSIVVSAPATSSGKASTAASLSAKRVSKGVALTSTVKVAKHATKGVTVKVQKRVSGHWKTVKTLRSATTGKVAYTVKTTSKKRISVRIYVPATSALKSGHSRTVKR